MSNRPLPTRSLALCILAAACSTALQAQNAKPPKAQLWIDVSTGTMAGMPEMDMPGGLRGMPGGMMPGAMMGGAPKAYGLARGMNVMPPRVLDIAFHNSLKPGVEVAQLIPPGMRMGESLPLLPPRREAAVAAREHEPGEPPQDVQRPRGRILVYWGCSETVRAGQPRVIDLARGSPADFAVAFAGRHAPDRGARIGPGHVLYPNERNTVALARDSSLTGEHRVRGDGVPTSMKFTLGPAQDVMPAIQLRSRGTLQDSIALDWTPVPQARAYYVHAMASRGEDMVMWSSAETPDTGMGIFDYLPNATIEKWTRERVLLAPETVHCAVPAGIFAGAGGGREEAAAMLRMMAYGGESSFAHPPRPSDPKATWEPEWAVRVRVKSHTMAMLGQEPSPANAGRQAPAVNEAEAPPASPAMEQPMPQPRLPTPGAILRGILGR